MALFATEFAHWHHFFESIPVSSLEFYKGLEEELTARKVPDTEVARVDFLERGLLSGKRVYLEVRRDWMIYHICVAPFGTGFFVSSRLLIKRFAGCLLLVLFALAIPPVLLFVYTTSTQQSGSSAAGLAVTVFMLFVMLFLYFLGIISWIMGSRLTYHRLDSMLAFHEAIHRLLVAKINVHVEAVGLKPLSNEDSKPVLHKLLRR
jgi:hypothetical protein